MKNSINEVYPAQLVAERLKNERKRLGFTQKQFAENIGISEASYNRYEKYFASFDSEVIWGLQQIGADVMYILFGVRQIHSPVMVSDDFLQVFTLYNQLDSVGKEYFLEMAELFLRMYKKDPTDG